MHLTRDFVVVICIILTCNCIVTEGSIKQDVFLEVDICFDPSTTGSTSHKVTSYEECALWCLQTEGCKSYSVETSTHMCYLNDNLLNDTGCLNGFMHCNSKKAIDNPRCLNEGVYNQATNNCRCFNSYVGDRCERLMQDCSDGFDSGHYNDMVDIFTIQPMVSQAPIRVRCTMKWGGRTTILRQDTNKPYVNFTRGWSDYKIGFGNMEGGGSHYIGNDAIHFITANRKQNLMINAFFGASFRQYTHTGVQVASEFEKYRLTYEGEWGHGVYPLGDCFPGNDIPFSTIDQDNDADLGSCALKHMSGWWFDNCGPCNPTGQVQADSETYQNEDPTSLYVVGANNLAVRLLTVYFFA